MKYEFVVTHLSDTYSGQLQSNACLSIWKFLLHVNCKHTNKNCSTYVILVLFLSTIYHSFASTNLDLVNIIDIW